MSFDPDLKAIQEVRDALRAAHSAQKRFAEADQAQVDQIVGAMARAVQGEIEALARLAVEETAMGVYEDKIGKNRFAAVDVYEHIRAMRTVGILSESKERGIVEIAQPMGVVAAIIPTTNPTSTAIYKILISVKARNGIVISPHPRARACIGRTTEIMANAARDAGAPDRLILCLESPTLESTQHLMSHDLTAVILATGGSGLVKAAYSSGKPAFGVGPGNVPAYIDRSADVAKACRDIVTGTAFDNGTICASEQSAVVDAPVEQEALRCFEAAGAYILSPEEKARLEPIVVTKSGAVDPAIVGQHARDIAGKAGIEAPEGTKVLIARLDRVGKAEEPLSVEKLSPILGLYVVADWVRGCERCIELLSLGGMGHTLAIHAKDESVIREFGLKKPVFRIVVNTPSTHGAIGLSTGLAPAMTLGCGAVGGNITGENVSPLHLINTKRLAYGIKEVELAPRASEGGLRASGRLGPNCRSEASSGVDAGASVGHALSESDIERIVEDFLRERRSG